MQAVAITSNDKVQTVTQLGSQGENDRIIVRMENCESFPRNTKFLHANLRNGIWNELRKNVQILIILHKHDGTCFKRYDERGAWGWEEGVLSMSEGRENGEEGLYRIGWLMRCNRKGKKERCEDGEE